MRPPKFLSKDLIIVSAIAAAIYILFISGFRGFFIGFGIAPLDSLAKMFGVLLVFIIPTYFISKILYNKMKISFLYSWIAGVVVLGLLAAVGAARNSSLVP